MDFMDIARAVRRAERSIAAAEAHCLNSQDLCRIASTLRGRVSSEVRRHPYRRAFRLARGASDGATAKERPRETTDRRCPYCQSDSAIRALGRVEIEAGHVRSAYCCATCNRAFVFIRRALS